jgi:hypothetical protein
MAGDSNSAKSPHPSGPFIATIGGYVPNGLTAAVVDVFTLPFDCQVESVWMTYRGGAQHLDAVQLLSVDGSLDIVAAADMSAAVLGVKQTLAAACKGITFKTGDQLKLLADSSAGTESGDIRMRVFLRPVWSRPKQYEL